MRKINNALWAILAGSLLALPFSCQKEEYYVEDEVRVKEIASIEPSDYLDQVFAVEYNPIGNNFVTIGSKNGYIDIYMDDSQLWNKLQEHIDIDDRYTPEQFVGFAIGDSEAQFGITIGNKDGKATAISCSNFSGEPYFGKDAPKPIGDLTSALGIAYDSQYHNYYVVGEKNGLIDIYYGQANSWKKLEENRDLDNHYAPSEFVDIAFGGEGQEFGIAIGNLNGRGTSVSCSVVADRSYFDDNAPQLIGNLTSVLAIEYNAQQGNYYVFGIGPNNDIDVYYGFHNNWTKLQEVRDLDNVYSAKEFTDFAFGDVSAESSMVVGNTKNYKTGQHNYEPRGTYFRYKGFSAVPF